MYIYIYTYIYTHILLLGLRWGKIGNPQIPFQSQPFSIILTTKSMTIPRTVDATFFAIPDFLPTPHAIPPTPRDGGF